MESVGEFYETIVAHTMEHHSAIKKNEILPSATTWMDLVIQRKTNTI